MMFHPFLLPYGRKFLFGTFRPKTSKKLWKDILSTTGVKFQNAGVALYTLQSATPALKKPLKLQANIF